MFASFLIVLCFNFETDLSIQLGAPSLHVWLLASSVDPPGLVYLALGLQTHMAMSQFLYECWASKEVVLLVWWAPYPVSHVSGFSNAF